MPAETSLRGRPPHWPQSWITLAEILGGYPKIWAAMGFSTKSTLRRKIHGEAPWCRQDVLLVRAMAKDAGVSLDDLLPVKLQEVVAAKGECIWNLLEGEGQ